MVLSRLLGRPWLAVGLSLATLCVLATWMYAERRGSAGGEKRGLWRAVSWTIGWMYFFAWSLSFYPQLVLNHRKQSTEGLSYNFVWLNLLGFFCYSVFNCAFYFSEKVQESYKIKNSGDSNLVKLNDVFFAVHATVVTSVTLVQMYMCGLRRSSGVQTWYSVRAFIWGSVGLALAYLAGVYAHGNELWVKGGGAANFWTMLQWLYAVSYIKLIVSFIKYCPQVYLNYSRKSTVGWSLHNVMLDFTGGLLSFVQLFLDASLNNHWSGIYGDPVKLGLSILSLVFDIIFLLQHYILYPEEHTYRSPRISDGDSNSDLEEDEMSLDGWLAQTSQSTA